MLESFATVAAMWIIIVGAAIFLYACYGFYCLACDVCVNVERWLERRKIERMLRRACPPRLAMRVRHR